MQQVEASLLFHLSGTATSNGMEVSRVDLTVLAPRPRMWERQVLFLCANGWDESTGCS